MATTSFTKEFSINKRNANKIEKALRQSRAVAVSTNKRVVEVRKESIKGFLGLDAK